METLLGDGQSGLVFIVSAPTGTGKTTLVRRLMNEFPSIIASISYTTRLPREEEKQGVDYHFISEQEFKKKIEEQDFLEYVQLYGTYYGTSTSWVEERLREGKHVVLVIDTQGTLSLKGKIEVPTIFIKPPSLEILKERLLKRETESLDIIEKRLAWVRKELEASKYYDYQLINDHLDIAYEVLRSIFIAECHKKRKS